MEKIKSFTDLLAWQEGHKLVLMIYKLTQSFPSSQQFSLITQIQRASISVTSNISEGFSRKSKEDSTHFFYMALGSLTELQNQLLISRDLSYCSKEVFAEIANQTVVVSKLLNGLIKSSKKLTT